MVFRPDERIVKLHENSLYQDWKKSHEKSYLSHFFCSLGNDLKLKSSWEIGYFNPDTGKISVFVEAEGDFIIKPEDDVFKQETTSIEKLDLHMVKKSFEDVSTVFQANLEKLFPNELLGDGFIVLQTLNGKVLWNFTMITKTLKFVNAKINAEDGSIDSHQIVNLVDKKGPLVP